MKLCLPGLCGRHISQLRGTLLVVKPCELTCVVPEKSSHADFKCVKTEQGMEMFLLPSIQNLLLEEKWENKCLRGISRCLLLEISMLYNRVYNNCL